MTPKQQAPIATPTNATKRMVPPPSLLSAEEFVRLRDVLADYSGVYLDTARQRLLESGIVQRLQATGDDLLAYERRLHAPDGRNELRQLAELVLNHETIFFRNQPHLRALREVLLPEIDRRKPRGAPIRIWSAGCATGEEAYSLAITALETLGRPLARPVEILATDLSTPALDKAREGFYRSRALQNLTPELLERYFKSRNNGYVVGDPLRALVRFDMLNLLEPFPKYIEGIDIIFCQNVTIYFQLRTCQQLIARFYDCLPVGGLLFLGFSETLWNVFDQFYSRELAGAYVYYKGALESATPPTIMDDRTRRSRPRNPLAKAEQPRSAPGGARTSGGNSSDAPSDPTKPFLEQGAVARAQSDQAALAEGRELLAQSQIAAALDALRRVSPQSACAPQALTLIARAHADRDDLDLATAEVQRAIEIDSLNEEAYLLLGIIYGRQGQWPSAIQQFERARYLSAGSALVSFHLAEAYRQAGHVEKAVREYGNTLRKLDVHPPGALLDGVAVVWLRETCKRQIAYLPRSS
jgi:chemotaxis protein methyltransferase CheR